MKLIIDIPNSLYANLAKIGNGSIAGKRIVECVKHGKPYKSDVLDKIRAEIEDERIDIDLDLGEEVYYNKAIDDVLQIIDRYRKGANE